MTNIAIVCGSYHKTEIERMLNLARDQAEKENLKICLLYTSDAADE